MPDTTVGTTKITLGAFIAGNRDEILQRCRALTAKRIDPAPTDDDFEKGIPLFLDHLIFELGDEPSKVRELRAESTRHGHNLYFQGFTIAQVVKDYGDVCQSVTGLAVERNAQISSDDFRTLNRCLDDGIAGAVSEFSHQQELAHDDRSVSQSLQLKNMVLTATTAFRALRTGNVGINGATGDLLDRILTEMHERLALTP